MSAWIVLATGLVALSMHINYLMGILWIPWAGMVFAAHLGAPRLREISEAEEALADARQRQRSPFESAARTEEDSVPMWAERRVI